MIPSPAYPPPWLRAATAFGLDRLVRRLRAGSPLVVMYHGVAPSSPWPGKFLDPEEFRRQLDGMARAHAVVSLDAVAGWIAGQTTLPPHPIAITFDDAYANLLDHALPELQRRGWPATIFASSHGLFEPADPYWFDEVDVRLASRPDRGATVRVAGRDFAPAALRSHLKALPKTERDDVLARLRELLPVRSEALAPYRTMTRHEIARVAAMGFEVGGHTASHVVLARENEASQRREIVSNFEAIREATDGRPPRHFAYPNGKRSDVDTAAVRIVREAGYRLAVTTEEGFVVRGADPFRVPRISAGFFGMYGVEERLAAVPLRVAIAGRKVR